LSPFSCWESKRADRSCSSFSCRESKRTGCSLLGHFSSWASQGADRMHFPFKAESHIEQIAASVGTSSEISKAYSTVHRDQW